MIEITFKIGDKSNLCMSLPKRYDELKALMTDYNLKNERVLINGIVSDKLPELWRLKDKIVNLYEMNYFSTLIELLSQEELQRLNAVLYDINYVPVKKMINAIFHLFGYMLNYEDRSTSYEGINAMTGITKPFEDVKPLLGVRFVSPIDMNAYVTIPTSEDYIKSVSKQANLKSQSYKLEVYPLEIDDNLWNCIEHIEYNNLHDLCTFVNTVKLLAIDDNHCDRLRLACTVLEVSKLKEIKDATCLLNNLDEFELIENDCVELYSKEHIEKLIQNIKQSYNAHDEINELYDLIEPFILYKQLGESMLQGYELQEVSLGYLKYPKNLCIEENEERREFEHGLSLS